MAISGGSVPVGAAWAPTGGTAKSIVPIGSSLSGNLSTATYYLDESLDLLLRRTLEFTARSPTTLASAPNGLTQQRNTATLHHPILLANGKVTTNTVTVTISYDPETDAAERTSLREFLSMLGDESDFDGWMVGAVA